MMRNIEHKTMKRRTATIQSPKSEKCKVDTFSRPAHEEIGSSPVGACDGNSSSKGDIFSQARALWLFGDWELLAELGSCDFGANRKRAAIALFIANAYQALGDNPNTKKFIDLALEYGCTKKVVSQALVSNVHNTLGRFALLKNKGEEASRHFEQAISFLYPTPDAKAYSKSRQIRESAHLGLYEEAARLLNESSIVIDKYKIISETQIENFKNDLSFLTQKINSFSQSKAPFASDLTIDLTISLPDNTTSLLRLAANRPDLAKREDKSFQFDIPADVTAYLTQSEQAGVTFATPPKKERIVLTPDTDYMISGHFITNGGDVRINVFDYDYLKQIGTKSVRIAYDTFSLRFRSHAQHECISFAIKLDGSGSFAHSDLNVYIQKLDDLRENA